MRNLKTLLLGVTMLMAGVAAANDIKPKPIKKTFLSTQITKMLANNKIDANMDLTGEVLFTLNEDREIVVLNVKTNNKVLADFIKRRLNYKKVKVENYRDGKTYTVPVTIEKK